jgi:predicted dehydrogenase
VLTGTDGAEEQTITDDTPFVTEIREFTAAVQAGRQPVPDLLDAEIALGVVLAIYESAQSRQPVQLREFLSDPASAQR